MPRGVPVAGFRKTKNYQSRTKMVVAPTIIESKWNINERFDILGDVCHMVARREQPAMLILGPGGIGKSYSVIKNLEKAGLKDVTFAADFEIGTTFVAKKIFRVVKGYCTPRGLYKTLFDNKDSILVCDDMDSVLKDPTSISLLKAALDSSDRRMISWKSDRVDDEYPNSFLFNGSVVFISNMDVNQMDQAVLTRTLYIDLSMSNKDKVDRIRTIASQKDFMPDFSAQVKNDAVEFIDRLRDKIQQLNLRTLIQVIRLRASAGPKWARNAEYVTCGG